MHITHISQSITTMSRYNAEFPFDIAFPPQAMTNVLAEWLGAKGVKQCHIAGESVGEGVGEDNEIHVAVYITMECLTVHTLTATVRLSRILTQNLNRDREVRPRHVLLQRWG